MNRKATILIWISYFITVIVAVLLILPHEINGVPAHARQKRMIKEIITDLDTSMPNGTHIDGMCMKDGKLTLKSSVHCENHSGCRAIQKTGQCCPEYQCECERNGTKYSNGAKLFDPETPCTVCYCQGGEITCSNVSCYHRDDCVPKKVPGRCCPEYDNCPPLDVKTTTPVSVSTTAPVEHQSVDGNDTVKIGTPQSDNPLGIKIKEITKPEEIRITDDKPKNQLPKSTSTTASGNSHSADQLIESITTESPNYVTKQSTEYNYITETSSERDSYQDISETSSSLPLSSLYSSSTDNTLDIQTFENLIIDEDNSTQSNLELVEDETSSTPSTDTESSAGPDNAKPAVVQIGNKVVIVNQSGQTQSITLIGAGGLQRGEDFEDDHASGQEELHDASSTTAGSLDVTPNDVENNSSDIPDLDRSDSSHYFSGSLLNDEEAENETLTEVSSISPEDNQSDSSEIIGINENLAESDVTDEPFEITNRKLHWPSGKLTFTTESSEEVDVTTPLNLDKTMESMETLNSANSDEDNYFPLNSTFNDSLAIDSNGFENFSGSGDLGTSGETAYNDITTENSVSSTSNNIIAEESEIITDIENPEFPKIPDDISIHATKVMIDEDHHHDIMNREGLETNINKLENLRRVPKIETTTVGIDDVESTSGVSVSSTTEPTINYESTTVNHLDTENIHKISDGFMRETIHLKDHQLMELVIKDMTDTRKSSLESDLLPHTNTDDIETRINEFEQSLNRGKNKTENLKVIPKNSSENKNTNMTIEATDSNESNSDSNESEYIPIKLESEPSKKPLTETTTVTNLSIESNSTELTNDSVELLDTDKSTQKENTVEPTTANPKDKEIDILFDEEMMKTSKSAAMIHDPKTDVESVKLVEPNEDRGITSSGASAIDINMENLHNDV